MHSARPCPQKNTCLWSFIASAIYYELSFIVSNVFYIFADSIFNSVIILALIFFVALKFLFCANQMATRLIATTWQTNAFVLATENSLPQFKNIPQSFSLASVEFTLFTILILYKPFYYASLNGINKSIVSPLWEILKNPPLDFGKSLLFISLATND